MAKRLKDMLAEADATVKAVSPAEAWEMAQGDGVTLVDIRDIRELWRDGAVPGAWHVPRGMVEFWIDPDSPYAKERFQSGDTFVFFCAGGLRSALTAKVAQEMGLEVAHVEGGFGKWREGGLPTEAKERK